MKKLITPILCIFILFGCKKDQIPQIQNVNIEGLELSILQPCKNCNLRSIHFIDELNGFACGYNGIVIKTIDGGLNWEEANTNTSVPLFDIYFVDKNIGFAVGGESGCSGTGCVPIGAVILKTVNGGDTWEKVNHNIFGKMVLNSVHFISNKVGFAIGKNCILRTEDGGDTWSQEFIKGITGQLYKMDFNGTQNGNMISTGGQVLSTNNSGKTWEIISSTFKNLYCLSTKDNDAIFVSGQSGVFKSHDEGKSWIELPNSPQHKLDVNFISPKIGIVVGSGEYSGGCFGVTYGSIYYTTNGGKTWDGNNRIEKLSTVFESTFPTNRVGYAVCANQIVKMELK